MTLGKTEVIKDWRHTTVKIPTVSTIQPKELSSYKELVFNEPQIKKEAFSLTFAQEIRSFDIVIIYS